MAPHRVPWQYQSEREPDAKRIGERRIDTKKKNKKCAEKKSIFKKVVIINGVH